MTLRLRTGRKVQRTLYIQQGPEPSDNDVLIGMVDNPKLAITICDAVNEVMEGAGERGRNEASTPTPKEALDTPNLRLPSSLKVGPLIWPIQYDERAVKEASQIGGPRFGHTNPERTEIVVDPHLHWLHPVVQTIIHEALHAAAWTYGINLGSEEEEEQIVGSLSSAVLDMIRHNPVLINYLINSQ